MNFAQKQNVSMYQHACHELHADYDVYSIQYRIILYSNEFTIVSITL